MRITLYVGGPGTGKTYLLKQLSKNQKCHIICPTWLSAEQCGGCTIYFYCGCSFMKFKSRPFLFDTVFIDEIFMFNKLDMMHLLECAGPNTQFIVFGDPFQLKNPNDNDQGYWYECLDEKDIKRTDLTTYYRSIDCPKLQHILQEYRIQKTMNLYDFKSISIKDASKILEDIPGAVVLCGTHDAEQQIRKKLKFSVTWAGSDGQIYRMNENIYTMNKYGSVKKHYILDGFDDKDMLLSCPSNKNEFLRVEPVEYGLIVRYEVRRGDVITVNLFQGLQASCVIIDAKSMFEFGSIYTAISRVHKYDDVYVLSGQNKVFEADKNNRYVSDKV